LLIGLNFLSAKIVLELLFRFTEIKAFMKGKVNRRLHHSTIALLLATLLHHFIY